MFRIRHKSEIHYFQTFSASSPVKTQCKITQPHQLTCTILLMKQQQFSPVLPHSCFFSGRYDFRNINMNKQCPMSSAFIGPASLQIFDMTFDKRMACWNDHRFLGAPVGQTLIKG